MYSLFLDHSFDEHVAALFCDGRVVKSLTYARGDTRHPCEIWQGFLKQQQIVLSDISFFVCGVGPGSYTGIRSAAAIVQASAYVDDTKTVPISSLLLCVPKMRGSFLVMADAHSGGTYVQKGCCNEARYEVEPPCRMSVDEAVGMVGLGRTVFVHSSGWLRKKGEFDSMVTQEVPLNPEVAALVAYQEFADGHAIPPRSLPLLYLRKTQPEERSKIA